MPEALFILKAALAYAEAGICVLPVSAGASCGKPAKQPLTAHGVHDASNDPRIVEAMFRANPFAALAVACGSRSGIVVVDCDRHAGQADGVAELAKLESEGFAIPRGAPRAATAGGGVHYWLRVPAGTTIKSRKLRPGIDLLADGKYALAAPSILDDGRPYRWMMEF
ncbi:hypothetical protein M2322_000408 [Rhodoblastus acidophilus]|uniref:bifunctional DNA primase/polymerase n=1 Tax=Rhodoblastus acidophilus TaxID=1074 RepID=UPI00222518C7|nr:bifunctional DNA primase/polymerase [Rhodoblastus acidophilus]MCW2314888.1 hypothetical protein [Rhodoblastus acidophilus]